ncbi:MAG: hypothetical protein HY080_09005 [Gammaproteobacteria bacterium]|nr:hypothetical protein [Gammaproteobacteria bacterium]
MPSIDINFRYYDGAIIVTVQSPLDHENVENAFLRLNALASTFPSVCALLAKDYGNDRCGLRLVFEVLGSEPPYSLDEHAFFEATMQIPGMDSEVAEYLRHVVNLRRYFGGTSGVCHQCWYDEETPVGEPAAHALLRRRVEYIDLYIDFLRTNDLNVEVNQGEIIEEIVSRHGWNPYTLKLAGARASDCGGQHGFEQIKEFFQKYDLGSVLRDPANFMHYFHPIVAYYCSDDSLARDPNMMRSFIQDAFPDSELHREALARLTTLGLLRTELPE